MNPTAPPFPGSFFRLESKLEQDLWCRIVIQCASNTNKHVSTADAAKWADAMIDEWRKRQPLKPARVVPQAEVDRLIAQRAAHNADPNTRHGGIVRPASIPMPPPKKDPQP